MSRGLVTFGVGPHSEMLDIALPSFRAYAQTHGYRMIVCRETIRGTLMFPRPVRPVDIPVGRPWSWMKIQVLITALMDHEEVLWLDADVVIVDGGEDIASLVPANKWQGVAMHCGVPDGDHPNHGVWLVRRKMVPTLCRIWAMTQYMHHPWWEQAASLELLGYRPCERPVRVVERTELRERTELLGGEWNALVTADVEQPRFMHAASRPDRVELMKGWANAAAVR